MKNFQVGMLIPWVNLTIEDEIPIMVNPNIGLHWSRMMPSLLPRDGHDDSYMSTMLSDIPNALSRLGGLNLDVYILGCTSISFTRDEIDYIIPRSYRKENFISTFDAVINSLSRLSAHRILLFAPYEQDTLCKETGALRNSGFNVVKAVQLEYEQEIRYITATQIYNKFILEYTHDCDTILFSCTALYTREAIDLLRNDLKIRTPIISSNSAIAEMLNGLYNNKMSKQFS